MSINDKELVTISVITLLVWPFVIAEKIIIETIQKLGIVSIETKEEKIETSKNNPL